MTAFGRLIRDRRIAAGLSVRSLATAIGVSAVGLGEVERGKSTLLLGFHGEALVDALGNVTLGELAAAQAMEDDPATLALSRARDEGIEAAAVLVEPSLPRMARAIRSLKEDRQR